MRTISEFLAQALPNLVDSANAATSTIFAAPSQFGTTNTIAGQLAAKAAALDTEYNNAYNAKLAYESAIKARDTARAAFAAQFTEVLAQSYTNPAVTNAALASIGLSPKATRTPKPLRPALELVVKPNESGIITARWKRNQNSPLTVFNFEMLSDEGEWEIIWAGTRIRTELSGFTPGESRQFRVVATKGGEFAAPSNVVVIYPAGPALRVAA